MFKSQEEKQRRFDREMKRLLDSFDDTPATIRVQFVGERNVVMRGGKMFIPPTLTCEVQHIPVFISDKIALLKVHGARNYVDGVGKWLDKDSFYVDVTPSEWRDFYAGLPSARRAGNTASL